MSIMSKEQVNHPNHYSKNGKECIDIMEEEFSSIGLLSFCILNEFKYRFRQGSKEGNPREQDAAKAEWYHNYAYKKYMALPLWKRIIINVIDPHLVTLIVR